MKLAAERPYLRHAMTESRSSSDRVPIGDAELRAIEGHMRQELDKLFGSPP